MRAVRLCEGPEVRVEEVPGQMRVAIQAAGVCGTDLHAAHGRLPVPTLPVIMGHEGAGIVDAVGEGVSAFQKGDRVLLLPSETCGTCPACETGHLDLCPGARVFGMARDGTSAEKIAVPASCALPLRAEVPFAHGAMLADAGRKASVELALASVARGGRVIVGGVGMESPELGPLVSFVGKQISVLGSMGYTRAELERVVELAASGKLDLSGSITGRHPLERAAKALDDLGSHRGDPVCLALVPGASS